MRRLVMTNRVAGIVSTFVLSFGNFCVTLALQHVSAPQSFGIYALTMVFSQLGVSISNALFCTPLVGMIGRDGRDEDTLLSFMKFNVIAIAVMVSIVIGMLSIHTGDVVYLALTCTFCFCTWLRWFYRGIEMAERNYRPPAVADLIYGTVVMAGAVIIVYFGPSEKSLIIAMAVQIAAALAAFLSLGTGKMLRLGTVIRAPNAPFLNSLNNHGKWSFLGVITTETTANAHSYVIGMLYGPAAFAPVAAIALFFRPLLVLAQALTQYTRPELALEYQAGRTSKFHKKTILFSGEMLAFLVLNAAGVFTLIYVFPWVIAGGRFDISLMAYVAAIMTVTYIFRSLRSGPSAGLQATLNFRQLSAATMVSAPVTILATLLIGYFSPQSPVEVLYATAFGEVVACALMTRAYLKAVSAPKEA